MAKIPKQLFTQEFRNQVVKSLVENKLSVPEAARRLNMSAKTLANWVHKSRSGAWDTGQSGKAVGNLEAENSPLLQNFATAKPNEVWVTDLTCITKGEDWRPLTGIKDLHTCEIVGYSMGLRMTQELVGQALYR